MIRKLATAAGTGFAIALLSASAPAFADTAPGASGCQPAQGQITAAAAQAGVLQQFVPAHAPINEINLQSLCLQP